VLSAISAVAATSLILETRRCQVTVHKHSTLDWYDRIHDEVHDWLNGSFADVTLDDFCQASGYSRRSVQRALQHHGTSWRKALLKSRMMNAADLLVNYNDTIGEIADIVGYSNPSLFTRHFTSYFGKSPMVWRRDERRNNGVKPASA